jgi:hypothetical protein
MTTLPQTRPAGTLDAAITALDFNAVVRWARYLEYENASAEHVASDLGHRRTLSVATHILASHRNKGGKYDRPYGSY